MVDAELPEIGKQQLLYCERFVELLTDMLTQVTCVVFWLSCVPSPLVCIGVAPCSALHLRSMPFFIASAVTN